MTDLNFEGIRENQNTKGCTPAYLALIDNFARQYTPQILFDVQRGDGIYTADRASLRQYSKNGELSYFFGLLEIYNAEGLRRKDITIFSPLAQNTRKVVANYLNANENSRNQFKQTKLYNLLRSFFRQTAKFDETIENLSFKYISEIIRNQNFSIPPRVRDET